MGAWERYSCYWHLITAYQVIYKVWVVYIGLFKRIFKPKMS